eukprot:4682583-Pyramimonas_sp.AAC.1
MRRAGSMAQFQRALHPCVLNRFCDDEALQPKSESPEEGAKEEAAAPQADQDLEEEGAEPTQDSKAREFREVTTDMYTNIALMLKRAKVQPPSLLPDGVSEMAEPVEGAADAEGQGGDDGEGEQPEG